MSSSITGGSTGSALQQDFQESDNMMAAQSEEAAIDAELAGAGSPIPALETVSGPSTSEVISLGGGSPVSPGS